MILFFLCLSLWAAPIQEWNSILRQDESCLLSLRKMEPQQKYLFAKLKDRDPKSVVLAAQILSFYGVDFNKERLFSIFLSEAQIHKGQNYPTKLAREACDLLQGEGRIPWAEAIMEQQVHGFWLQSCLFVLTHSSIPLSKTRDYLIQESSSFPNHNLIRTELKRRGSSYLSYFLEDVASLRTKEGLVLYHDVIWGIAPPDIPEDVHSRLMQYIQNGPPHTTHDREERKEFVDTYNSVLSSLYQRFSTHRDSRIEIPPHQPPIQKIRICP